MIIYVSRIIESARDALMIEFTCIIERTVGSLIIVRAGKQEWTIRRGVNRANVGCNAITQLQIHSDDFLA